MKIYWFIQQAEGFGGTEMVSLQILSSLADKYDITLVLTSKEPSKYIFDVPDNVSRKYLNYKIDEIRSDYYMKKYLDEHHFLKACSLAFRLVYNLLIKRFITRHKIKKMTTKDDILIATSLDNYLVMPRKRTVFFHYHFNAKFFFSWPERLMRLFMRLPNKYIFLCKSTMNDIKKRSSRIGRIATYAINPVRFASHLDSEIYNNELIYVGRFMGQKNPLFLLRAMKILKDKGVNFHLHMYGDGPFKEEMVEYLKDQELADYVLIHDSTPDIIKAYQQKDLMLVSSIYEGFSLVMLEANSQSLPVITTDWGDAVYEMVEDGENGYVISDNKEESFALKVAEVLNDKEKLKYMKEKSFERSADFSVETIALYWQNYILVKNDKK